MGKFLSDVAGSLGDALSAIPLLIAIAQLDGFFLSRRCSRRNRRNADRAAIQHNLGLNCRIPAGIQDLTTHNAYDFGHL